MTLKKYIWLHLALTVLVSLGTTFPIQNMYGAHFLWLAYLAVALTSLPSLLAFFLVFRALEKPFQFFLNFLIGGMLMKMLIGITAIISLSFWVPRENLKMFAVIFLICYLLFTTLEVTSLMRKNKQLKQGREDPKKTTDNHHKDN